MSNLERNCRILLHFYPRSYRKSRGRELVNTILDTTASDRHWPRFVDARSLMAGGIRERVAHSAGDSARGVWRSGAQTGILTIFAMRLGSVLKFRTLPDRSVWHNLPAHVWLRSAVVVVAIVTLSRAQKLWQSCLLVTGVTALIGSLQRSELRINLPDGPGPASWFLPIGFLIAGIVLFRTGAARPGVALPLGVLISVLAPTNQISLAMFLIVFASATLGAFIDPRWSVAFFTVWVYAFLSITVGSGVSPWQMLISPHTAFVLAAALCATLGTHRYARLRSI
jgi:hypothetical protein